MIAYKYLAPHATGRFSLHAWPTPTGSARGAWIEAKSPLVPCMNGIHACRPADLPYWIDTELWEIELSGHTLETPTMIVAERGRLVRPVATWNAATQKAFTEHCVARGREIAAEATARRCPSASKAESWARDAAYFAERGEVGTVAYVVAVAAHALDEEHADAAYAAERASQARWLTAHLALS